ncbi:uncharacterized protein LOC106086060 [Stomoxys calcitrans]|uniref:uncharacterized protein LOC106086060 n=1 Tax=Stomoxys calcitrans TaxID=35570 RepID=UPI0027E2B4CB|nr:uncharacterized protein LOC106086060 [Stomoxys calcitrans]
MIGTKIVAILALLAATKAQQSSIDTILIRNDEYLNSHRRQYALNIWYYDVQMEQFRESYVKRVDDMEYQKDALLNELKNRDENLYSLTLLSDFSKTCVEKYKPSMPVAADVKNQVDRCTDTAHYKTDNLIYTMEVTNKTLQNHYDNVFEKEVSRCQSNYGTTKTANYTLCLANAVSVTNAFTQSSQQQFSNQLKNAYNTGRLEIKTLHECVFVVHNNTLTKMSQANTHIDRCILGMDDCAQCSKHFCRNVYNMAASSIDPNSPTMYNPFQGQSETGECLMLNIY